VILKGAAIAPLFYADPVERDVTDLDLLVRLEDVRDAVRALAKAGYAAPTSFHELLAYRRHHFHFPLEHRDSHVVEIHWALSPPGSLFQLDEATVIEHAIRLERPSGPPFKAPRPEHMILHLVLQNLQEGFSRVARTVDIDRIISAVPALDWDALASSAVDGRLVSPAALSLRHAMLLLGTPVREEDLCRLLPSRVARFHLAGLLPASSILDQRYQHGHAGRHLLELWLLRSWRDRWLSVVGLLRGAVVAPPPTPRRSFLQRAFTLGKVGALQLLLCARTVLSLLAPHGRAQTRFWSSQARISNRL
jgi:hypothetical protein